MSLILDALKKSEAERRRGLPPGLSTPFSAPRRRRKLPWVAGAGAVLLAAGLAGGWVLLNGNRDQAAPDLAAAPAGDVNVASASAPGTPTPGVDAGAPLPVALASAESKAELPQTYGGLAGGGNGGSVSGGGLPVPQRAGLFTPSTNPESQVAAKPAPSPEATSPAPEQSAMPTSAPTVAALEPPLAAPNPMPATIKLPPSVDPKNEFPTTAQPLSATQQDVLIIHQLPYAMRKELPKLELSMHVYSPVAEERFIVLNGKRFHLSSPAPGPDLNLVDIVDDGAVLEFRGQKFLLPRVSY